MASAGTSNNQYGDALSRIKLHASEAQDGHQVVDWSRFDTGPLRKSVYGTAFLQQVAAAKVVESGTSYDLLGGDDPLCVPYDGALLMRRTNSDIGRFSF